MQISFRVDGRSVAIDPEVVVVAGFTGRDAGVVRKHLEELAAEGIFAPSKVPAFYKLPPSALIQADELRTVRGDTSGEAEIALFVDGDDAYVTLASDHTDRGVEAMDIALSKEVCAKPIARVAWRYAEVAERWDGLRLRSWVQENGDRCLYQDGRAEELLPPDELLTLLRRSCRAQRFVVLTGTVPALGGIRSVDHFWAELDDPERGRRITLDYAISRLDQLEAQV